MKRIKFAGPSKRMAKALEDEGLKIQWPKTGTVKDKEDLAIECAYYTGAADYEKLVTIDLRDSLALGSKAGVDNAISYQLRAAYDNYDLNEELKANIRAVGALSAADLVEDLQEAEKRLERFADVADAVASGRPIPDEKDTKEITLRGCDAKRVADILDFFVVQFDWKNTPTNEEKAFAKMISNELKKKLED